MREQTNFLTYTGPISPSVRRKAELFYKQFPQGNKAEQVRLNTLAVLFVNSYLQYMGFNTDLKASDNQNILCQLYMDIADLSLKNDVYLECRPVLEGEYFVHIPPESQSNRIGYVVVQINKSFREATLLGFIKEVKNEHVPINQLQSLDNLLDCLEHVSQPNYIPEIASSFINLSSKVVDLKQWFDNTFDVGWQDLSTLLDMTLANPCLETRNAKHQFVRRGKLINLGKDIEKQIVLIVTVAAESEREMDVIVEIHPVIGKNYLFPHLHLSVLDADGEAVMETHTRDNNKNIQLEFSNDLDEIFNLRFTLGDVTLIESFIT